MDLDTLTLDPDQAVDLIRGMLAVATVDGIKPEESALIDAFADACRQDSPQFPSNEALKSAPFDPRLAAAHVDDELTKALFVHTLAVVGYADGHYSEQEQAKVREIALALGLSPEVTRAIEDEARETVLAPLMRLENTDSVRDVLREASPAS